MKSLYRNASWISPLFSQGSGENNWNQYTPTVELSQRAIKIGTGTSSTQIVTFDKTHDIQQGDTLLCRMSDGSWEQATVEGVTEGSATATATRNSTYSFDSATSGSDPIYIAFGNTDYQPGDPLNGGYYTPDGKQLFVNNNGVLQECILSTPFNPNTIAVTGKTLSILGYSSSLVGGFTFANNGRYLFCSSTVRYQIYRYTMTIPYDLSTAYLTEITSDFGGTIATTNFNNGVFSADGTKFIIPTNGTVSGCLYGTCAVPFCLSTATVSSATLALKGASDAISLLEDGSGYLGVALASTITYGQGLYKGTFGTPWNPSTAAFASLSTDIGNFNTTTSNHTASLYAIWAPGDGRHATMISGYSSERDQRHNHYDVEATNPLVIDVSTQGLSGTPTDVYYYNKPKVFVATSASVAKQRLYATNITASGATLGSADSGKISVGDKLLLDKTTEVTVTGVTETTNGLSRIDPNASGSNVYIQKKSGFASYDPTWTSVPTVGKFTFTPDGMKIIEAVSYNTTGNRGFLRVWNLSSPWDISTATEDPRGYIVDDQWTSSTTSNASFKICGCQFNDDGTKFYVFTTYTYSIHPVEFILSTPYDLYTMKWNYGGYIGPSMIRWYPSTSAIPLHCMWSNDGSQLVYFDNAFARIYTLSATTPWDLASVVSGNISNGNNFTSVYLPTSSTSGTNAYIGGYVKRFSPSGKHVLCAGSVRAASTNEFINTVKFKSTGSEDWSVTTWPTSSVVLTTLPMNDIAAISANQFITDTYISPDGSRYFLMTDAGHLYEVQMRLEPLNQYDVTWATQASAPTTIWTKGTYDGDALTFTSTVDSYDTGDVYVTETASPVVVDTNKLQVKIEAAGRDSTVNTLRLDLKKP